MGTRVRTWGTVQARLHPAEQVVPVESAPSPGMTPGPAAER